MIKLIVSTVLVVSFSGCNYAKTEAIKSKQDSNKEITAASPQFTNKITDTVFRFENYKTGELPAGWTQSFTGKGTGTEWKVIDDNGNKVIAQLSKDNPNYHFNIAVFDGIETKDVELTVKIKGVAGRMDRGGGFVWRYTDKDNYYVVRENPLEDNVVLYKVKDGKRTDLPVLGKGRTYGVDVEKLGDGWNTLKLIVKGDLFTVYLNGKELFKVKDRTFENSGKTGLWTKADAVSYFDDLTIKVMD